MLARNLTVSSLSLGHNFVSIEALGLPYAQGEKLLFHGPRHLFDFEASHLCDEVCPEHRPTAVLGSTAQDLVGSPKEFLLIIWIHGLQGARVSTKVTVQHLVYVLAGRTGNACALKFSILLGHRHATFQTERRLRFCL